MANKAIYNCLKGVNQKNNSDTVVDDSSDNGDKQFNIYHLNLELSDS